MKIEMLDRNKQKTEIDNVTTVILPCSEENDLLQIKAGEQAATTTRHMREMLCVRVTGNFLEITASKNLPLPDVIMIQKLFIDRIYGLDKVYIEGFFDDDGKGRFATDLGDSITITENIIKGGHINI